MAARRVTQSSVNWASLAERVPANQRANFIAFKSRSDKYLRSVQANPETAPKIDWARYKQAIPVAGLVDSFQKQYEAVKIPYPEDTFSGEVDKQEAEVKREIETFKQESEARIANYQKEIARLKSLLPFDQMTLEDFRESYPDVAIDPLNKPTFWPHNPEEQFGYKPKDQAGETGGH
ncbi:ATP synthase subunit d, mitochondrial [Phlebotomus argentipes]|uniref:ATP synthase subunit d, mitochondrial n=1 Tax=Phlebotomus argentipes TaxID=94469 RepID=UPI00289303E6|nr:ATP synthase subunit d, mitochondrial [Phlebotomus argentipes]